MIDPKQGPFPSLPRRGRGAAAWIEYDVGAALWHAIDDPSRPAGRSIDEPAADDAAAIDAPPVEPSEDMRPWTPQQPPREADPRIPSDRPGPTDPRPRPH